MAVESKPLFHLEVIRQKVFARLRADETGAVQAFFDYVFRALGHYV